MKSRVLSIIVIVAFYGYILFGLMCQTPGLKALEGSLTPHEVAAVIVSFFFGWLGICFTGYFTAKWILK